MTGAMVVGTLDWVFWGLVGVGLPNEACMATKDRLKMDFVENAW